VSVDHTAASQRPSLGPRSCSAAPARRRSTRLAAATQRRRGPRLPGARERELAFMPCTAERPHLDTLPCHRPPWTRRCRVPPRACVPGAAQGSALASIWPRPDRAVPRRHGMVSTSPFGAFPRAHAAHHTHTNTTDLHKCTHATRPMGSGPCRTGSGVSLTLEPRLPVGSGRH
jgi:hypothetical protein